MLAYKAPVCQRTSEAPLPQSHWWQSLWIF